MPARRIKPQPGALEQAARARLDDHTTELKKEVYPALRALVAVDDLGAPDQVGSCVLIQLGDRRFLVTAAHVLDHMAKSSMYLAGDGTFVELAGRMFRTSMPSGGRLHDQYDVGYMEISENVSDQLGGCVYFTPETIDPNDPEAEGTIYAAIGYPAGQAIKDAARRFYSPSLIAYTTTIDSDAYRMMKVAQGVLLPLQFIPRRMRKGGRIETPPKPDGISGGAVFRFDNVHNESFISKADKLVAIITEWRRTPRSVLIATRITLHLEAIVHEYPELRAYVPKPRHARIRLRST